MFIIKKNTLAKIFLVFIFFYFSITIFAQKKWIDAIIIYNDLSIDSCKVKINKNNFYSSFKILKENKIEKIFPNNIKSIKTANEKYISIYFDSINYGVESYSFAKIINEFELLLIWTKFKEKTCTCQKYGAIEKGYFLYYSDDKILRIYTDIANNILNKNEFIEFCNKHWKNAETSKIIKIADLKKINYF